MRENRLIRTEQSANNIYSGSRLGAATRFFISASEEKTGDCAKRYLWYNAPMSPVLEKIEKEFKKLAPKEQLQALSRFEAAVYGEEDPAFIEELKRRVADIKSGKARGQDAFGVLRALQRKYSKLN